MFVRLSRWTARQEHAHLAVEQINSKGGILGRPVELLIEDSTSGDAGTAVQKARKLIERDKVSFLLGNVNSALSLAVATMEDMKLPPEVGLCPRRRPTAPATTSSCRRCTSARRRRRGATPRTSSR
jgi:substrate-binding family protein